MLLLSLLSSDSDREHAVYSLLGHQRYWSEKEERAIFIQELKDEGKSLSSALSSSISSSSTSSTPSSSLSPSLSSFTPSLSDSRTKLGHQFEHTTNWFGIYEGFLDQDRYRVDESLRLADPAEASAIVDRMHKKYAALHDALVMFVGNNVYDGSDIAARVNSSTAASYDPELLTELKNAVGCLEHQNKQ